MTRALVFPGQGSQAIGMGADLARAYPAAKAVFDEVDEALGEALSRIIAAGPEDQLTLTRNAQPALMAVSLAVFRVIEDRTGRTLDQLASFVAGHSLGEYSALAAAGALSVSDTARLLRRRGEAMQRAVPVGEGAMAALMGLDFAAAQEIAAAAAARTGGVCQAANDNAPGQVVISGASAAVQAAIDIAGEKGAKRAVLLPVSAPFHCALMAPAAEEMREALAEVTVRAPVVPLVANVTAAPVTDPVEIRELLVRQVTGTVRWRESVAWLVAEGVGELVEVGAGKVLAGLARRIDRSLGARTVGTPEDLDAFLATL